MYELIKKIKAFSTLILEIGFYKAFTKPFSNEDAEYMNEVHQRKLNHRVYDDSVIDDKKQQNISSLITTPVNYIPPNNDSVFKQESAHSNSNVNQETQNLIDTEEVNVLSVNGSTSIKHTELDEFSSSSDKFINNESMELVVDDLLTNEDSFVEHVLVRNISTTLPQPILTGFFENPDLEDFPVISNEDEWFTPDIIDTANEEDIWEESLLPSVAIEAPPTRHELFNLPDRLTRAERALQIAIRVGDEFDWDRNGIKILATIFNRYWWSSSQTAMRRAIESGMIPKELILAEELRQMWYEHPDFWSAMNKSGEICHQYSLISWPTALKIIRSFNSYPQIEEVEALLNECLERWLCSSSLQHRFKGFYMYVLYRVGAYDDLTDHEGWIIFDHYPTDETEFADDLEQPRRLRDLGVYIDPQAERYATSSWDGRLMLRNARHGHELYDEENSL
ncbi:hypothetical protein [Nitrosomonas communis]|uniref:hypothetical protein n=1 Tax=Nitrosomonas communis TaxID=44574 RepID=UPI0026ECF740|nr:hypothetical protein [Nitrosomonas communis]MCO6428948.1 hypothetical protein [Nitrosomonas communis]